MGDRIPGRDGPRLGKTCKFLRNRKFLRNLKEPKEDPLWMEQREKDGQKAGQGHTQSGFHAQFNGNPLKGFK